MRNVSEELKEIKGQFRYFMNGTASQLMREKGLNYKLNFGIEIPRIKEIAVRYGKDHDLAQSLWKEEIREAKILATLIQPYDTFFPEIADIWIENINNIEMAEQACMNLFQFLDYAPAKAFEWLADEREYVQTCGFLLVARLLAKGGEMNERAVNELVDQALSAIRSGSYHPGRAALMALRKYAGQCTENANDLVERLGGESPGEEPQITLLREEIKNNADY